MTDDVLDDPILDDRIRRALNTLADSHAPIPMTSTVGRHRGRRPLAAAAALLVLGGIGALVLAGQRDGAERPVSTQTPVPVDSAAPDPTEPSATTATSAPVATALRFDSPTPEGMVAVLDPAPLPSVTAFTPSIGDSSYLGGRGATAQVIVLAPDGSAEATVSVTDLDWPVSAVPVDEAQDVGLTTELRYVGRSAFTFYLIDGASIRELSVDLRTRDEDFSAFAERLPLAVEVAEFVEGQDLQALSTTDRLTPAPFVDASTAWTVVSYNDGEDQGSGGVDVVVIEADRPVDSDEFQLLASLIGEVLDRPSPNSVVAELWESPQLQYVEQVSPNQIVLINAPIGTDRDELDTLISSLTFVDAAEAGITFESLDAVGESIGRGEESWGRWEVYAPVEDGGCFGFGATLWTPGRLESSISGSGCPAQDGTPSKFLCVAPSTGEVAGLFFGDGEIDFEHPSIDSVVIGVPGEPIDGLGIPTPFLIDPADAALDPLAVLVDGEPIEILCS